VALELPENYLKDLHQYEAKSEDHLRYMHYTRYTPEETAKIGHLWTQGARQEIVLSRISLTLLPAIGHTDLGSYTLLARQNVAALQIKDNVTGEWKWAKPQPGTFTVNSCDALSFLTGNYIKSTVHRVSSPPKDQAHLNRLGLLYFAR
jgi:isopenicillin N synthase-like dioxygenase